MSGMPLSGPGVGLPVPQGLYPASLLNGELQPSTNYLTLAPGQAIPLPRGTWWVQGTALVQNLDPISGTWRNHGSALAPGRVVTSDGFDTRVANLTGCAVAATVTTGGTNYVQATTTVTPSAGNSTWQAVVGGRVATPSISAAGAGYGVTPLVFFDAPPNPGVQATGVAVMANGTISSITMIDVGAGYQIAPKIAIYPSPFDPNYLAGSAITPATAVSTLTGAGNLSAVLCTNSGAPFTSLPTLTIAGAGASAVASIIQLTTLLSASITSGGAGFNSTAFLTTSGGIPSYTEAYTNPSIELTGFIPRAAVAALTLTGTTISALGTIVDGGLFAGTPTGAVLQNGAAATTPATIALTFGGANQTVQMQRLG